MRLQDICDDIMEDVDGALGCALVDLGTGLPLAMTVTSDELQASGAMETLAAAGTDYFGAKSTNSSRERWAAIPVTKVSSRKSRRRRTRPTTSCASCPGTRQTVLLLITDKTTNLGLGWVAVRRALRRVEQDTRRPAVRAETGASPPTESPDPETPPDNPMNGANRRIGRRRYRRR